MSAANEEGRGGSSASRGGQNRSVCIVGGGVIGLCAAWYALKKGMRVTVLERGAPDHTGCSTGNAGMIVPSHFIPLAAPGMVAYGLKAMRNPRSPFYIRPRFDVDLFDWGLKFAQAANANRVEQAAPVLRDLNLQSRRAYEELETALGDFGLVRRGLLMLCRTEHGLEEEAQTAEMARRLDVPAEVLTPDEAARVDPGIRMDIKGAVHFPLDAHLTPDRFLRRLTDAVTAGGAKLHYQTEVTGWRTEGNGRIAAAQTAAGDRTADEFILAGGSWSPQIARPLRLRLPLQAGKGYSVTLPQPPQLPTLCSILSEARVAVTPMGTSLRLGGTMELSGLDETVRAERVQGILDAVPTYFPAFQPADLKDLPVWHGFRPCSPDGLPYVGRTRAWQNLIVATGHAMMGLSLAPVTGQIVADLLTGETPSLPLALLDPDRYTRGL